MPVKRSALAVLLAVLLVAAGGAWWLSAGERGHTRLLGPLAERPSGGDFTLAGGDGPVSLAALRGKVVLLYFGYTNCPDVCPASLAAGSQALTRLTGEERGKTRMLLISVDPERDTPARLKEYAAYFHPEMLAATGTAEQIATVAQAYGASYAKHGASADGSYAVDHSAQTYVIAPDGKLAEIVDYGASAATIVAAVRRHAS